MCPRSSATDPRTARDLRSLCVPTVLLPVSISMFRYARSPRLLRRLAILVFPMRIEHRSRFPYVPRSRLALKSPSASSRPLRSHFALAVCDCGVLGGARQGCIQIHISYLRLAVERSYSVLPKRVLGSAGVAFVIRATTEEGPRFEIQVAPPTNLRR
ncbi:hypothetical protein C8F04DRAFT_241857 [Mycena alexandri]|uniref:Uncharacterized protein n=1 Tax=Mycena alexandri TaxID=1745969 RepID=A0AAD6S8X0_9AGAR|nr:hypothetical protein C8F04DRAFT_241857 [Mycena alexandri]